MRSRPLIVATGAMSLVFFAVLMALSPGINGAFYYDDIPILKLASEFYSGDLSFFQYMQGGFVAGSLGRPLSMLTFLWPASAYPDHPQVIFVINIALHAINAVLVGLLAWRIGALMNTPHALWLGVFCAALWGLAPIQTATVLIAVQRMAELSALFIWLGLLLWVIGLERALKTPGQGVIFQVTGLIGMPLLAVLSKENGVLLPILAGVIEATLLTKLVLPGRRARHLLYLASIVVVVGYLALDLWRGGAVYLERDFTIWERLITEAGILFEYLRQSLAPRFLDIHPFHEAYPVVRSLTEQPIYALAVLFWPLAAIAAWVYRKRWPVVSMAILWFLVAHMLESSVIGLELYFDHRQYLAWFGPVFALTWGLLHVPAPYQRVARITLLIYIAFLGLMMRQTAELWGHPVTSAHIWFDRNPGSARAAEFLAKEYLALNRGSEALGVLEQQIKACPECLSSIAQSVQISCVLGDKEHFERSLNAFFEQAPKVAQTFSTSSTLLSLHNHIQKGQCTLLDYATLGRMNQALLERTQPTHDEKRQELLLNLYRIAVERRDISLAAKLMLEVYAALPRADLSLSIVRNLLQIGSVEQAQSFVDEQICNNHPKESFWSHGEWGQTCLQAKRMLEQP
ncbi:MAG: hypothetical protein AB1717_06330 [Pseudomonadota bacterium]